MKKFIVLTVVLFASVVITVAQGTLRILESVGDSANGFYYGGFFPNQAHYRKDFDAYIGYKKANFNVSKEPLSGEYHRYSTLDRGRPTQMTTPNRDKKILVLGYKSGDSTTMNDLAVHGVITKNGYAVFDIYSTPANPIMQMPPDYQGNRNHIIMVDSSLTIKWKLQDSRFNDLFPEKILSDDYGNIYMVFGSGYQNYADCEEDWATSQILVKISGIDGSILFVKNLYDLFYCNFMFGGAVIKENRLYLLFNFSGEFRYAGKDYRSLAGQGNTNICFLECNLNGDILQLKPVLSEEPKIINTVWIAQGVNDVPNGSICCTGRRGGFYCQTCGNINPYINNQYLYTYPPMGNNNPYFVIFNKDGNIIKTNGLSQ